MTTTKKTAPTLDEISRAVLALWLRTKRSASSDDIARHLGVSTTSVRKVIAASTRYNDLDCSRVPGCRTHHGGSGGALGRYPASWSPDTGTLCALIRGEGEGMHRWLITGTVLPVKRAVWDRKVHEEVLASTESEALTKVRDAAVAQNGELHSNTRLDVEWLGRVQESVS